MIEQYKRRIEKKHKREAEGFHHVYRSSCASWKALFYRRARVFYDFRL